VQYEIDQSQAIFSVRNEIDQLQLILNVNKIILLVVILTDRMASKHCIFAYVLR